MNNAVKHVVVDLDGTLIKTDILYESFWCSLSRDWRIVFLIFYWLLLGIPRLKFELYRRSRLDVKVLPYNKHVIDRIRKYKSTGREIILLSASTHAAVEDVAKFLGLFDVYQGTAPGDNLKGKAKLRKLQELTDGNFEYIGDSWVDIPLWKEAQIAVVVSRSPLLMKRVHASAAETVLLAAEAPVNFNSKVYRPHQWLKNLLLFAAPLAAHSLHFEVFTRASLGFLVFSLIASSVYALNDLLDLRSDRLHHTKKNRPFASGDLDIRSSIAIVLLPLCAGLGCAYWLGPSAFGITLCYWCLTTVYSFVLKRMPLLDIITLAMLYVIRIVAGGIVTGIDISFWLLAFSLFIFISLAACKRVTELVLKAPLNDEKLPGRGYRYDDLNLLLSIATSAGYISVLVLSLYLNTDVVTSLYQSPKYLWGGVTFGFLWINRMIFSAHTGLMHDDPVVFALKDSVSRLTLLGAACFIWLAVIL